MADGARHDDVRMDFRPHPAADVTAYAQAKAGQTVAQMLGEGADTTLTVTIGGVPVPQKLWAKVRPKAGQRLVIIATPRGGGNNNKLLKLVVLVVAAVYFYYTGDYRGAMQIVAYGFTAVNILVPPPMPRVPNANAGDPFNVLASLTGTQNNASPYSPIPIVIGTCTFYPPHAALPFTEILGDDQWLRMLLDCGYGDLDISDIKIGNTPIDDYDDVEYEVTTTPTLFTQDVFELQVGTTYNTDTDTASRTSQALSSELSFDLQFPQGLYAVHTDGSNHEAGVYFKVEYRKTGDPTWINATGASGLTYSSSVYIDVSGSGNTFYFHNNTRKTLRAGIRWKVPTADQYDVQITRTGTYYGATAAIFNDAVWTVLRSISYKLPSTTGTTKLALRIRATDQLQGVVSTVNLKATQRIPVYDAGTDTWTPSVATANNAWVYHWLMTASPATARPVAMDRMHLESIVDWAADCDAMGYEYNHVESDGRTLWDAMQDVLASGRATFGMPDGKYGCVRDVAQTVPRQMFTPSNSWDFSGQRTFYDPPHGLRCRWTNTEADNQEDELVVYAEGYTSDTATRFEVMDLRTCTNPIAVWRIGSYHLEAARKRANVYSFTAGMENLVCQRGDLVECAQPMIDWGIASGRVKSVSGDRVVLEGPFEPVDGVTYGLRVRRSSDNTLVSTTGLTPIYTWDSSYLRFDMDISWDDPSGPTRVFTLTGPLDIQPGDLYVLGDVGETITRRCIVQRIQPQSDLAARLTVVDEAPTVPVAGTGTPPAFVSQITGKPWCAPPDPPDITIRIGTTVPDHAGVVNDDVGGSGSANSGIHRLPLWKQQLLGWDING